VSSRFLQSRPCQRGAALITVISVVAFLVVLTTGMAVSLDREVRLSGFNYDARQVDWLAQGVEAWAANTLALDARQTDQDNLTETWAEPLPVTAMEHGEVWAQIEDLQGRLNLNSLVKDGKRQELQIIRLRRLLALLELDVQLVDALVDWIDPDERVSFPQGAEDDYYLNQTPARRAGNTPLISVAELRWIKGVDEDVLLKLSPHVATLPSEVSGINVNTADALVLASLAEGVTVRDGEQLVADRDEHGPFTLEGLAQHPVFAGRPLNLDSLLTASGYFRLSAKVRFQDVAVLRLARLWRDPSHRVHVIGRWSG